MEQKENNKTDNTFFIIDKMINPNFVKNDTSSNHSQDIRPNRQIVNTSDCTCKNKF